MDQQRAVDRTTNVITHKQYRGAAVSKISFDTDVSFVSRNFCHTHRGKSFQSVLSDLRSLNLKARKHKRAEQLETSTARGSAHFNIASK